MAVELSITTIMLWAAATALLIMWNLNSLRRARRYREIAEDCAEHDSRTIGVVDGKRGGER